MRQRGLPEKLEIFLFLYWNEMASRKKGRRWNKEDKILWISARCIVHPLTFPFFFFRINFSPKLVPLQSGKDLWHIFPSQQKPQTSPESWEWIEVKTGVGSGTFFSEVQDEIRRFCAFLFISTPFLEFWLFVMVAIGRRCRYYVTLQFSRKSSFVNRAQGFCYLLPRYSLLHAFTDRLILPFLSSAVDLHTWVVCIFDSGERYLIWSYVRLCVDEILECTLKKECEVIKHPWPVIFPSRDHKNF